MHNILSSPRFRLIIAATIIVGIGFVNADEDPLATARTPVRGLVSAGVMSQPAVDQPATVNIAITIAVADVNHDDSADRSQKILDELQLSTLHGHDAMLQFGQQILVQDGSQMAGRGPVRTYRHHETGTMVEASPQVSGNRILLKLQIEKSWLEFLGDEDDDDAARVPKTATYSTTVMTTMQLTSGESQSIRAAVSGGTPDGREVVITVVATLGAQKARPTPTRPQASPQQRRTGGGRGGEINRGGRGGFETGRSGAGNSATDPRRPSIGAGRPGPPGRSPSPEDSAASAKRLFERLDKNKDGQLDDDDLEGEDGYRRFLQAMEIHSLPVTQSQVEAKFRDFVSRRFGTRPNPSRPAPESRGDDNADEKEGEDDEE